MKNNKSKKTVKARVKAKKKAKTKIPKESFHEYWDKWEGEARKRSAWGEYANTMHRIREAEDNVKLAYGTDEEKSEIKERRSNRSPMMYIG